MSEQRFDTTGWDREQVRRQAAAPEGQRRRKKKKKRGHPILKFLLYIIFVVATSALLAGVGWLLANDLCALNKEYIETTISVSKEDDVPSVTEKLKEGGLIEYKWFFRLFAWVSDAEEKIGEGEYQLNTDMDYRALIVGMMSKTGQNLQAETVQVTIPEGYTVEQTIALLAEKGVNTVEALTEAAENYNFEYTFLNADLKGSVTRLEGYLFPNTYEFYVGEKASNALNRLLKEFDREMNDEIMALVDASGRSLDEVITLASLIEKETDGTDRAKISSVIHNRINNPGFETAGLLQIDAALVYATGNAALTEEDKALDSPYNLYLYAGLPPTPIANPGLASIKAALEPENTDYYYYVLGNNGRHIYSTSYAEHLKVIAGLG